MAVRCRFLSGKLIDLLFVHVRFIVETMTKAQTSVEPLEPSLLKKHSVYDWCSSIASIRFTEGCNRPDQPVLIVTSDLSRNFTYNSALN